MALLYFFKGYLSEGEKGMISNQKLQNALKEIKDIAGLDTALFSAKGKLLAATFEPEGAFGNAVAAFADSAEDATAAGEHEFFRIVVEDETEFVLLLHTVDEHSHLLGQMAVCQIRNLTLSYAEQFDRNNFIRNVLLGNLLAVDIYSKAKKLHIEPEDRQVFVIDTGKKNIDIAMELVKNLSDTRAGDFVTSVDEHSIVLVKSLALVDKKNWESHAGEVANRLVDNLHMEAMIKVRVGYGNVVSQIPELCESFQEAKMALEVGRVFYAELDTISYGKLGIGRLIYQLPMSLCEMYLKEVFGDTIPEILSDEEAMSTINKFFENSLNISETARQLYVHRNTLVYRLERIQKAIGLDIRNFEDAMMFRIAVMVLAHVRDENGTK
jgi:carbohydrate diacid regulator